MKLDESNQIINKCRGEFIGEMALIETMLGFVLSVYLMPKRLKYGNFIFSSLNVPIKLTILEQAIKDNSIFKKHSYIKTVSKKGAKLKRIEGLPNDIKDMQEIRNHFAHSLSDIPFIEYNEGKPIIADKISFKNGKNMERDFWDGEAKAYDISKHSNNLIKLDKIKTALQNILHYYGATQSITTRDEKDEE